MRVEIKNKLANPNLIYNDLLNRPETYNTILQEYKNDWTQINKLRHKLNKLFSKGKILKTDIRSIVNGTRRKTTLYFRYDKKYNIVVVLTRLGQRTYYFKSFTENKYSITLNSYYELVNDRWIKRYDKTINNLNILKWH